LLARELLRYPIVKRFRRLAALALSIAVCSVWLAGMSRSRPESVADEKTMALRRDALRRAQVRISGNRRHATYEPVHSEPAQAGPDRLLIECRFVPRIPTGTTAKFDCALPDGEVIKIKYGRNPELHAEVAATRLLAALGYAADEVTIVPRVRCHGCPRYPFATMQALNLVGAAESFPLHADKYVDFDWVSVEHRFGAAAIEAGETEGWAWWELKYVTDGAPRADLDALRLLAVFLAHWDNKSENQRLVCLDRPGGQMEGPCARPLLMIQDLGATFGPLKVNLAQWGATPIWADQRSCAVTMRHLPYGGGTFTDAPISEDGRAQLARRLSALTDDQIRSLFTIARFPQYYAGTDDERDLASWSAAFHRRVNQIVKAGPCPG
jgi:hypothetical protein